MKKFLPVVALQILISVVLLTGGLVAMQFPPAERFRMETSAAAAGSISTDSLYPTRVTFIVAGMCLAGFSAALFFWSFVTRGRWTSTALLEFSIACVSFYLGWMMDPYWVHGIYQVYSGNIEVDGLTVLDPKRLIPMAWSELLWFGVLGSFTFAALCIGPTLFIDHIREMIREREWASIGGVVICLALLVALMLGSPGYGRWMGD